MKICIYSVCKDVVKNVNRWYSSIKDADMIYVLDIGSKDNTIKELKSKNIKVFTKEIEPCYFYKARNYILSKIPNDVDICIYLELDEILISNWRSIIEENWKDNTTKIKYLYTTYFSKELKYTDYSSNIHCRKNIKWSKYNRLKYNGQENNVIINNHLISHYPTPINNSYLPLLNLQSKN